MISPNGFSVGNYIIDSDHIYKISKIADSRIYYLPINSDNRNQSVTGSIPEANALSSGFRHLLTDKEIKQFFRDLAVAKPATDIPIDSKLFKDLVCQNNPFGIIPLLKQLWVSKNNPDTVFSGSNRDILENIFKHLSLEFSLVTKKTPEKMRELILKTLQNKPKRKKSR